MVYLDRFTLPTEAAEFEMLKFRRKFSNSVYPVGIFSRKGLTDMTFEPVTLIYGGNGSGKTTLLNIIASHLESSRKSIVKFGELFDTYVNNCTARMQNMDECKAIKLITSDDVFNYLLDIKAINTGVVREQERLVSEYNTYKYEKTSQDFSSAIEQIDKMKEMIAARKQTASNFVRTRLKNQELSRESNGETALQFWQNEIDENSLYLIDEPENSLSAVSQIKLKQFIEESAKHFRCQFVIATHSPILLSIEDAGVYDLDRDPARIRKWTELENVRRYYDFFSEHSAEFEIEDND